MTPEDSSPEEKPRWWRRPFVFVLPPVIVIAGIAVAVALLVSGGTQKASAQTIHYQTPTTVGANPFTSAADTHGNTAVHFQPTSAPSGQPSSGPGTFGGSGSDYV